MTGPRSCRKFQKRPDEGTAFIALCMGTRVQGLVTSPSAISSHVSFILAFLFFGNYVLRPL